MQNRIYLAFEAYETLLRKRPDFVPAYMQLGKLCFQLGIASRGLELLQTALTHHPSQQERLLIRLEIQEQRKLIHSSQRF